MDYKDYYKILDLSCNASTEDIKKAYRRLAMQYHPDVNRGKEEWANNKIKEINEAFSVLSDPKKRRQYDNFGSVGNIHDIFGSQSTQTTRASFTSDFGEDGLNFDFLDDIFAENLRGTGFAFRSFKRRFNGLGGTGFEKQGSIDLEDLFEQSQSPRISSVNYETVLTKEQAVRGVEKEIVRNGKRLKVKIPAGVRMGSIIRLRDALKVTDGQAGDIIISIKVE